MIQFAGHDGHSEYLVTVHESEAGKPTTAEVAWRPDEWETFSAPVKLMRVIA